MDDDNRKPFGQEQEPRDVREWALIVVIGAAIVMLVYFLVG